MTNGPEGLCNIRNQSFYLNLKMLVSFSMSQKHIKQQLTPVHNTTKISPLKHPFAFVWVDVSRGHGSHICDKWKKVLLSMTVKKWTKAQRSNVLALRLTQQVRGGSNSIGMRPVSHATQPVTLGTDQIFRAPRTRLIRCFPRQTCTETCEWVNVDKKIQKFNIHSQG